MVDIHTVKAATRVGWLKWACTLCGSFAAVFALAVVINWTLGDQRYHWYALPLALAAVGAALATRKAVAVRLDDR